MNRKPRWIAGIEPAKELLYANGIQILEMECRQQPARLSELIEAYRSDQSVRKELQRMVAASQRKGPILFIGMGASLCSAISGSTVLQSSGRLSFSVDAGEWLHYSGAVWDQPALSILLTTSGESAELVELFQMPHDRSLGLICNNSASTCWQLAMNKLPILAGPEYGNATKTYTNATAASIILASEIVGKPWEADADAAVRVFSASLDPIFALRSELENFCRGATNIEIIGRGAGYGAAIMSALCIREMSGLRVAAHTGAGFRHGPNLDVDASHLAIIFALGRVQELGIKLAEECNRKGGKVVLVSEDDRLATPQLFPVKLDKVPEPWEGITAVLVAQTLTLGMVERTGCRLPPRFEYGAMIQ